MASVDPAAFVVLQKMSCVLGLLLGKNLFTGSQKIPFLICHSTGILIVVKIFGSQFETILYLLIYCFCSQQVSLLLEML